jgi:predicted lipoprotein with Yx(FWY)xxD motif
MKLRRNSLIGGAVVIVAAAVIAVAALSSAAATGSASTVKTGRALGKTVLVNRAGLTLYSLSAETKGRFICTGSCLSVWHPLVVRHGQKPTGAHSLAAIRRPGGQTQVTYKGKPLYTFSGDHKRGDVKGEGFKDVGVWHAVTTSGKRASSSSGGSGSGGGGGYSSAY